MIGVEVSEIALLASEFCAEVEKEIEGTEQIVGTVVMICDIADEDGSTRLHVMSSDKRHWVIAGMLSRGADEHALDTTEDEP